MPATSRPTWRSTAAGSAAVTIDGGGIDRVFDHLGGALTIRAVTIASGDPSPTGFGGGVRNHGGSVALTDSVLRDDAASFGGGVGGFDALDLTPRLRRQHAATRPGGGHRPILVDSCPRSIATSPDARDPRSGRYRILAEPVTNDDSPRVRSAPVVIRVPVR